MTPAGTADRPPTRRHARSLIRWIAGVTAASALGVMAAWIVGIEPVLSVVPGLATMKFNSALGFFLVAVALVAMTVPAASKASRRVGTAAAGLLFLLAAASLGESLFGWQLGIDELFVTDVVTAPEDHPGRMSSGTAIGFLGLSLALLLVGSASRMVLHLAQFLALGIMLLGSAAVLGYLFGVSALYRVPLFSSMALHTALLFVLGSVCILFVRSQDGLIGVLTGDRHGAQLARRLLPAVVLVPVLINWLTQEGVEAGYYGDEFAYALRSLSVIVLLIAFVWRSAHQLNAMQEQVEESSQNAAHLAAIVTSSRDAVISTDLEGRVTSWNDAAERMYGYSAEEMLDNSIDLLVPADRSGEAQRMLARVSNNETVDQFETVRQRKDGTPVDVALVMSPVRDDDDELIGVSIIAHDITALKRSEERFRATIEAAPIGMILSADSGEIALVNAKSEELFGYTRDELVGTSIDNLVPDRFRPGHPEIRRRFFEDPHAAFLGEGRELYALRKDGSEVPVEIGLQPFRMQGNWYVLSAVADITDRKKAADELRERTEELARSNEDLEQFAYIASHDLQEPLRAVSGCVQLLRQRYGDKIDERANEYIDHAVDGAARMQKLIDDLLTFSRVGRAEKAVTSVDTRQALDTALRNLETAIEESGAKIEIGELPVVHGVPAQFVLLFQNLVGNAIKFRDANRVPEVRIDAEPNGTGWRIAVADNGIGIEEQYFERIFSIFQRLHTSREYPGTGLGLALCRRIVERQGGRIEVESTPGEGTRISFTCTASIADSLTGSTHG